MREFMAGAEAISRAALAVGCDFFAGYPITPDTPIFLNMLRELPRASGVGIHGEDEIGSISMAIGAAMTGAKAMTATSGPGMSFPPFVLTLGVGFLLHSAGLIGEDYQRPRLLPV